MDGYARPIALLEDSNKNICTQVGREYDWPKIVSDTPVLIGLWAYGL